MATPKRSTVSLSNEWWGVAIPSDRFAGSSNGICGGSKPAEVDRRVAMHIIDRRLNPGSKRLENRQRFLRRAKALVQGAVKKSSQDRDIKEVLEGGEVSIPLDGMDEPRFRREGGTRDMVLPGNKKFIEGPADWNIYAAQASDGDNSRSDGEVRGRLLTEMILPGSQFFAYLEVGETGGSTFDMPDSALWTLYQRLRADGAPLSM